MCARVCVRYAWCQGVCCVGLVGRRVRRRATSLTVRTVQVRAHGKGTAAVRTWAAPAAAPHNPLPPPDPLPCLHHVPYPRAPPNTPPNTYNPTLHPPTLTTLHPPSALHPSTLPALHPTRPPPCPPHWLAPPAAVLGGGDAAAGRLPVPRQPGHVSSDGALFVCVRVRSCVYAKCVCMYVCARA